MTTRGHNPQLVNQECPPTQDHLPQETEKKLDMTRISSLQPMKKTLGRGFKKDYTLLQTDDLDQC